MLYLFAIINITKNNIKKLEMIVLLLLKSNLDKIRKVIMFCRNNNANTMVNSVKLFLSKKGKLRQSGVNNIKYFRRLFFHFNNPVNSLS